MQVTKSIFIQRALLGVFWVLGTVGFVCDEFVPGLESLRSYILLACDAVLVLIGLMTLRHKADFLFVGSDYKGTERFNRYEEYFADKGVQIIYFPYTKGTSSTQIRNLIISKQKNG